MVTDNHELFWFDFDNENDILIEIHFATQRSWTYKVGF